MINDLERILQEIAVKIHSERFKRDQSLESLANEIKMSKTTLIKVEHGKLLNINYIVQILNHLNLQLNISIEPIDEKNKIKP